MFEKLGVVTNSWARSMENGTRFKDLVVLFVDNGFHHIEIRDGGYLRSSEFGRLMNEIEHASSCYSQTDWQRACNLLSRGKTLDGAVYKEHLPILEHLISFFQATKGAVFSYAMSHPWLSLPTDIAKDNDHLTQAIKLAYLLCPRQARLRLVDLDPADPLHSQTAVSNLKRYTRLVQDLPVALTVENALQPAPLILELAVAGGVGLAYDEANNYLDDGSALNTPEDFWQSVRLEDLASVHLKQKSDRGVLACLGDGFVDIPVLMKRLRECCYSGDLLLEYLATDNPLQDAIQSCAFLKEC